MEIVFIDTIIIIIIIYCNNTKVMSMQPLTVMQNNIKYAREITHCKNCLYDTMI